MEVRNRGILLGKCDSDTKKQFRVGDINRPLKTSVEVDMTGRKERRAFGGRYRGNIAPFPGGGVINDAPGLGRNR